MLEKFINVTIKPVLLIGGLGTALAGLNAFVPIFAVENVQQLEWIPSYTIFVQHWGIMVFLIGLFMAAAAYIESWRIYLVVSNLDAPFSNGFYIPAAMDSFLTIYSILYFISLRNKTST